MDERSLPLRSATRRWLFSNTVGYYSKWSAVEKEWCYESIESIQNPKISVRIAEDGSRAIVTCGERVVEATTSRGLARVLNRLVR